MYSLKPSKSLYAEFGKDSCEKTDRLNAKYDRSRSFIDEEINRNMMFEGLPYV